ncbi:N-6 DNA methylase [Paenalcaligenes faecalis]|uniref:N-6 DNA methylase n=1 Tax=Paenalcaligenes faecalis TaxID=2980099 RepID=UPI0022B9898F|nr:N-6 DNA methylase [Paenalcaligenes faecalis]
MKTNSTQVLSKTLQSLLELGRAYAREDELLSFALTWLAIGRMQSESNIPDLKDLWELMSDGAWEKIRAAGIPLENSSYFSTKVINEDKALLSKAITIVERLCDTEGAFSGDLLQILQQFFIQNSQASYGGGVLALETFELLLDMLEKPEEKDVLWLPFDVIGMQALQAVRRGWKVNHTQILNLPRNFLPLLLIIVYGQPSHKKISSTALSSQEVHQLKSTHVITTSPLGLSSGGFNRKTIELWSSNESCKEQNYARFEPWLIHELSARITKQAIFCVSQNTLYTVGQERLLREYIIDDEKHGQQLSSIILTPPRVYSHTPLSIAIMDMVFNQEKGQDIHMVDLSDIPLRFNETAAKALEENKNLILGREEKEGVSRTVNIQEVREEGYLLNPNRYVNIPADIGPNAIPLSQICSLIRPSALSKNEEDKSALEFGIPHLGSWSPVNGPLTRKIHLRARDIAFLEEGDVVLSVKGTIGESAIVGCLPSESTVVSQSCVALRLKDSEIARKITPEYLLVYLRTQSAVAQFKSLETGANMKHLNNRALLESFKVPLPTESEQLATVSKYRNLCDLEKRISELEEEIKAIEKPLLS